jgi:nitrate reductase gamma subunit
MSMLVPIIIYASLAVFVLAILVRAGRYLKLPVHLRWELYPVAHEGKRAAWGGSYLEELDWWTKPRHSSMLGELKVMIPEILLLKGVWENNRPLWFLSFPFHFGLYLIAGFLGIQIVGAILLLASGPDAFVMGWGYWLVQLGTVMGVVGMALALLGAIGLFLRRLFDAPLRDYSSLGHFVNLAFFIGVLAVALPAWYLADPNFTAVRGLIAALMTFNLEYNAGSPLLTAEFLLAALLMAYIPLTHMSHFFMKYFLWHDIRWGDEPNLRGSKLEGKINAALQQPVSWSAPHIKGDGKKSWVDVAVHNPAQEDESK